MTQIGIEANIGMDTDPAVNIWREIVKIPEVFIRKLGDFVLDQE